MNKESKTQGRYSLVVSSTLPLSKQQQVIPFIWGEELKDKVRDERLTDAITRFEDKEKLPLSLIDAFTTQFQNQDELLNYLLANVKGVPIGKITIDYVSKGIVKHLEVAYSDQAEIKNVATKNFNSSSVDDSSKSNLIHSVAHRLDNERQILKYLRVNGYIDSQTDINFEEYMEHYNTANYSFFERKLGDSLSYKQFRGVAMGIGSYSPEIYREQFIGNRQIEEEIERNKELTKKALEVKPLNHQPSYEELRKIQEEQRDLKNYKATLDKIRGVKPEESVPDVICTQVPLFDADEFVTPVKPNHPHR